MHFHWQNLTKDAAEGRGIERRRVRRRVFPRTGRCWLYFGRKNHSIGFEWSFRLGIGVAATFEPSERQITLHCAPLLARFYLTIPMSEWIYDRLPGHWSQVRMNGRRWFIHEPRRLSLRAHSGAIWWCLWRDDGVWQRGDWRQGSFHPARFILGRQNHAEEVLSTEDVEIGMPEGAYAATVSMIERTWTRQRWPWWPLTKRRMTAKVDVPDGIPHPGKGENSWDYGDDALYGLSCPARTVEEAIGRVVESATRDRRRYGGAHWKPKPEAVGQ